MEQNSKSHLKKQNTKKGSNSFNHNENIFFGKYLIGALYQNR
jgi:hypothetical protein